MFDLQTYLSRNALLVEDYLRDVLNGLRDRPQVLFEAVEYSLFSGGKRIRPALVIASAEAVGGLAENVLPFACGIEMIHTFSLIHDDLPSMDNDDERRGKPSCHKAFGEGVAVLAGDALLAEGFALMANTGLWKDVYAHEAVEVIHAIAAAVGLRGMSMGQSMDLSLQGKNADLQALEAMERAKTGALIRASVFAGARLAGATDDEIASLTSYGEKIGLAFQIRDDLLDAPAKGRASGSDKTLRKATFPSILGVEESKKRMESLIDGALSSLDQFGSKADPLRELASFISGRDF